MRSLPLGNGIDARCQYASKEAPAPESRGTGDEVSLAEHRSVSLNKGHAHPQPKEKHKKRTHEHMVASESYPQQKTDSY